jgi:hypothetical protein
MRAWLLIVLSENEKMLRSIIHLRQIRLSRRFQALVRAIVH